MKLAALAVLAFAGAAQAQIAVADLGTGAPPATLGGFNMLAFGADPRPLFNDVNDITTADGAPFGTLGFGAAVNHRQIGAGWATWSHGYTGDVYYTNGATSLSLALPAGTGAFYFYVEGNPFDVRSFTATADDGTTLTFDVNGNAGARGYGFWTTGGSLTSISVSSDVDFAIGEFGAARIPAPGAAALLGLGGLVATRRRR